MNTIVEAHVQQGMEGTTMNAKKGLNTREVWSDGLPDGYETTCPFSACSAVNTVPFGADGRLVWWPTAENCRHFRGAYASGTTTPSMLFM